MTIMTGARRKLLLIDGHSLVYRAFFALPPLSMPGGQQTNAVYGLLRMLFRLLAERQPDAVIVAFDCGLPRARLELFPDYKAHRPQMPDELRSQFPLVREALAALGIAMVEAEGYEADDVIGTLSCQAERAGVQSLIVTGDRDALQLVSGLTQVCLTRKGITDTVAYDVGTVAEQWGLEPGQLLEVKALMGDASDNIPGVPGIGEKTALRLIQEFGSAEAALAGADRVGGRVGRLLSEHAELARISRQLAEIDRQAPVTLDLATAEVRPPDRDAVTEVLCRLGFRSLLAQVPGLVDPAPAPPTLFDQPVDDAGPVRATGADLEAIRGVLAGADRVALLLAPGIEGVGAVTGIAAADRWWWHGDDIDQFGPLVRTLLPEWERGRGPRVVGHQTKALLRELCARSLPVGPIGFDSELAWHLLDATRSSYPVSDLSASYLGRQLPELVTRRTRSGPTPTADRAGEALGRAAAAVLELETPLRAELGRQGLVPLFDEVELPLVPVLAAMEARGVTVDRGRLIQLGAEFSSRLAAVESRIRDHAGGEINFNSTQQVATLLFDRLGLSPHKKTKTGYSTDAEVLELLAAQHEVPRLLLEHRQLSKLKSTYVDGLINQLNPHTGRVHTRFNQTVTATGRLSSSDPNLQNIPIRMDIGRQIRRVFIPGSSDMVLMSADYSQIELRILAHLSADEALLASFRHGEDIHARTASEVFGVPLEQVTRDMRSRAKAVNFGIVYGITDFGLARDIGVDQDEARRYIEGYFRRYPGVRRFMDDMVEVARTRGYVTTVLARRRWLPDINSRNVAARKFAERTAFNTPVQGSAADIIKLAMLRVADRLRAEKLDAHLLLQVHDELVLEAHQEAVPAVARLLREEMEAAYVLLVPLLAEVKVGPDWSRMTLIEE